MSGKAIDSQGLPVEEAEVSLHIDGSSEAEFHTNTNHDGIFLLDLPGIDLISLSIEITHPHFKTTNWSASPEEIEFIEAGASIRVPDLQLERKLTIGFWVATLVFATS